MSEPAKAEPKLTGDALTIAFLKTNLAQLRTGGIVEVAMTNPNVMSYMEHWECRTEKAERALEAKDKLIAELVEALSVAIVRMEVDAVAIEGEWGIGKSLEQMERDNELPEEIVLSRRALSKAKEQE